jgi:DNA-binding response OmpR family regulator
MAAKDRILVIEDDPDIQELVAYNLEREGFQVHVCDDGEAGLRKAASWKPALVLLDLMLPGVEGLEVCRQIRSAKETRRTPVVMLTAKGEESDVVLGLGMGADDYIAKPFSPKEVIARIRAILRRVASSGEKPERLSAGPFEIDVDRHEVQVRGKSVVLTLAEYRLLCALVSQPGRVFTRDLLLDRITGGESVIIDRNIDVHIRALRKKLKRNAEWIVTVRGVGYKLKEG